MAPLPDDELLALWRQNLRAVLAQLEHFNETDDVGVPVPGDLTQVDPARRQVAAVAAFSRAAVDVLLAGQDAQTELEPELRRVLAGVLWGVRGAAGAARRAWPGMVGHAGEVAALELLMGFEHLAIAGLLRFGSHEDLALLREEGSTL